MNRRFKLSVFLVTWMTLGVSSLWAIQSPNFQLVREQWISGSGSGLSSAFIGVRGLVGKSGAGVVTSPSFTLILSTEQSVQPPVGSGIAIAVKGTIEEDDATVVVEAVNTVTATISGGTWVAQGVQLAEGPNTIRVTATDPHENAATKELHVTVDTVPPARPTLKAVVTPTLETSQILSGTKIPDTGIWLNGAQVVPLNFLTTWQYTLPLTQGTNPIELWAADRVGNPSTHIVSRIIHDATPPDVPIVTDDGRHTTSTTELHARWVAEEDATEIVNYAYAIGTTGGGTEVVPFTDVGTQTEVTHTGLSLREGTHYYFTVKATNAVGLTSGQGSSDGIRVNTEPPVITSFTPADGSSYYPPGSVPLSLTATDPSGDLLEYRFLLNGQILQNWSSSSSYSLDLSAVSSGLKELLMEVQDPFDGVDSRTVALYLFRDPLEAHE